MTDEPYVTEGGAPLKKGLGWVGVEPYSIGRNSYISEFSHISQNVTIGNFCSIGNLCTIGAHSHALDKLTTFPFLELIKDVSYKSTLIGSDVWIGSNSVVIAGVTIGHGAVIGAGSVVTKNVPPYAIFVGNPARLFRYRFKPEMISALLDTTWWDLPAAVIKGLPLHDPWACVEAIRAGLDKHKSVG